VARVVLAGKTGARQLPVRLPSFADPGAALPPTAVLTPPAAARSAPPPTTGDDALLRAFARTRDPVLRERLVERYLPLARYAAARYRNGSEPFEDLVQVASVGLLNAIDRFDPANGASFSSYALPTITGEVRRHFRDRGWTVRPPRDLQEQSLKVERTTERLRVERGTSPSIDDVARACDLSAEEVLEAREALQARHATSLSPQPSGDDDQLRLDERLGVIDEGFAHAEHRAVVETLYGILTKREREIIRLRFEEDLTQAEIGEQVGLSQMHVSRVLRAAVEKLRAQAGQVAPAS
jgi:RNA polymerase sigma-B factor